MKININNQQYIIVDLDKKNNNIIVKTFDHNNELKYTKYINEVDFIDLYNILVYAQDHNIEIFRLWEAK